MLGSSAVGVMQKYRLVRQMFDNNLPACAAWAIIFTFLSVDMKCVKIGFAV